MKLPISGIIITLNEERNIERCLNSLAFCQEIIVVDAESRDRTVEIASRFTSKVFVRPWSGYGPQKNFANEQAQFPWILSLDADEEVSPELAAELAQLFSHPSEPLAAAYRIARKTIHSGRWIRFGGWYPNRLVRFFRKDSGHWSLEALHERWETSGRIENLRHDLLHYSFLSFEDQVRRNNHYSSLGALELKKKGIRFSVLRMVHKSVSKFLETYVWKFGFLDGIPGFIISISASYSVFVKWAKLWEIEANEKRLHRHD